MKTHLLFLPHKFPHLPPLTKLGMLRVLALAVALAVVGLQGVQGSGEVAQYVVVGATGDLARKYLWQSLFTLWAETGGEMVQVFATTRSEDGGAMVSRIIEDVVSCDGGELKKLSAEAHKEACERAKSRFAERVVHVNTREASGFRELGVALESSFSSLGEDWMLSSRVFHLAIPPSAVLGVAQGIGEHCLPSSEMTRFRVLVEKPFGRSGEEARAFFRSLERSLPEGCVRLVDHYLGKAGARAIAELRGVMGPGMGALLHWSHLTALQVVMEEDGDVEEERRATYEELGGVAGDVLQNHGLTLAALALAPLEATGGKREIAVEAIPGPSDPPSTDDEIFQASLHLLHPESLSKPVLVMDEEHVTGISASELLMIFGENQTMPHWGDLPDRRKLAFPPSAVTTDARAAFLQSLKLPKPSAGGAHTLIAAQAKEWRDGVVSEGVEGAVEAVGVRKADRVPTAMRVSLRAGPGSRDLQTLVLADSVLSFSDGRGGVLEEVKEVLEEVGFDDVASGTKFGAKEEGKAVVDPAIEHGPGDADFHPPRAPRGTNPPPASEAGAPQVLGVPVVMAAGKYLGQRRAFVRYVFGNLGRLTVLLHGSLPVVLPASERNASLPDDTGPAAEALAAEIANQREKSEIEVPEYALPRVARVTGPAIIMERAVVQRQQLSRPEAFPRGFDVVVGNLNYTSPLVVAVLSTNPRTHGSRALAKKLRQKKVSMEIVARAHSALGRPVDAYTTILAAAAAYDSADTTLAPPPTLPNAEQTGPTTTTAAFLSPQEVLAAWDIFDPILQRLQPSHTPQTPPKTPLPLLRYDRGEVEVLGMHPITGLLHCSDPKCAFAFDGLEKAPGMMPPPIRDALNEQRIKEKKGTDGKWECVGADGVVRRGGCY